jgi:hypothetical protein
MTRDDKGRFVKGVTGNPAGRPKKEREQEYHDILVSVVTPAEWKAVVVKALEQAKRGDGVARKWLADYLIGPPVEKKEIAGTDGSPLKIIVEYADDTPEIA